MLAKLRVFGQLLTKLQQQERKALFQAADKSYELGTIGPGEILGLDVLMSTSRLSLFTYEVTSERFAYISVPPVAGHLLFNKDIAESTLQFVYVVLQHRMDGLVKKLHAANLRLEDDSKFEILNGQLTSLEKNVRQIQARNVNPVEIDMLAEAVKSSNMKTLETSRRSKVMTLLDKERILGTVDQRTFEKSRPTSMTQDPTSIHSGILTLTLLIMKV
jgi:hypothetical protein